ncbi:MAG TPA: FAD:protein FMN transferase [Casimicrobiaceae bacterium]|nr:FAD:protein FMN transferase [Casimicrobiaceae bacterium]
MAAANELQLWAGDESRASAMAELAVNEVLRIEAKYSRYRDESVVRQINRAAGKKAVTIDAETTALLRYADRCFRDSGGLFDITSGALRRAWDFRRVPPRLPDASELSAICASIGWACVEWHDRSIRLPREQMEIDFGGIGKEYAADRMAAMCAENGFSHALVNLAGDVRASGPQENDAPWLVGIVHPRRPGAVVARVELREGAIATSGDYERFFEIEGRRYSHIINPITGWPVSCWQSISVLAPVCIFAGSCSTIAMLLEANAEAFLRAQDVTYLAVDKAGCLTGPLAANAVDA